MGFIDKLNDGLHSVLNGVADFFQPTNDATCAKCIKCKQCVKTLSSGQKVRIFTCPAVDDKLTHESENIDKLLPYDRNPQNWNYYLSSYIEHQNTISKYVYGNDLRFEEGYSSILYNNVPVNIETLSTCYLATECSHFRPFVYKNEMTTNDMLYEAYFPDLVDFDSLSSEDKDKFFK